jgi:hypothetical protein
VRSLVPRPFRGLEVGVRGACVGALFARDISLLCMVIASIVCVLGASSVQTRILNVWRWKAIRNTGHPVQVQLRTSSSSFSVYKFY